MYPPACSYYEYLRNTLLVHVLHPSSKRFDLLVATGYQNKFAAIASAYMRALVLLFKMPRRYRTVNNRNHWTTGQLDKAKEAVENGEVNTNKAAKIYGIPYSTLRDHLKGNNKKRFGGRPTLLSFEEEKEISTSCQVLQQFGFPLNVDTVGIIVRDYLKECKRANPFKNSLPGYDWWEGFLRRWPKLVQRKPQHLPKHRALGTRNEVKLYQIQNISTCYNNN